ncbi:MAG: response regulator transcription factor [Treponema sp.]|jgi:NarL family two-component system response regulator LiaR|nr:response regulator transcription factor [Treponema sp.]
MIQVVLIDDHPLAINGIGAWLNATGRFSIAGTAGNAAETRALLESLESPPPLLILDIALGKENGLEIIPVLKEICEKRKAPPPGIVVCSMYDDIFVIQSAFDAGADAFISKSADIKEIITAIDTVLAGEKYLNDKYKTLIQEGAASGLTAREREITALVKQSLSNDQIAKKMDISVRTVQNHLAHIYVKTNTHSRFELAKL